MKQMLWLVLIAIAGAAAYWIWRAVQRWSERGRAAEARFASFMAETIRPVPPKLAVESHPQEKLLLEAAIKAGEAGEAALAIQLYARLVARYPGSAYAERARVGVEEQKRKLAKA